MCLYLRACKKNKSARELHNLPSMCYQCENDGFDFFSVQSSLGIGLDEVLVSKIWVKVLLLCMMNTQLFFNPLFGEAGNISELSIAVRRWKGLSDWKDPASTYQYASPFGIFSSITLKGGGEITAWSLTRKGKKKKKLQTYTLGNEATHKNMKRVTNTLKHTHTHNQTHANSGTQARSHGQPIKCNTPLENRKAEWIAARLLVLALSILPKWSLRFRSDSQKLQLFKFSLHNDLPSPCKAVCLVGLYLYLETILSRWILQDVGNILDSWKRPRISSPVFLCPARVNYKNIGFGELNNTCRLCGYW